MAVSIRRNTKNVNQYRILMLLENNPFPQDVRVNREAHTLAAAGYNVTVICPRGQGQPWHEVVDGIHAWRFPAPPEFRGALGYLVEYGYAMLAMFVLSLVVAMTKGFDVVHAHNPPDTLVFIGAFYKMFGKRFVFDHHDLAPDMYNALFENGKPLIHKILIWTEKLSCQLADHVIVTNNSYKQVDMERSGVAEDKITVVRNGPNLKLFRPTTPVAELRKEGKVTICYLGDMGHHDGVDYLLRALNHLVFDLGKTNIYCAMVGGGSAQNDMQVLSRKLELAPYVHFFGPVPHADVAGYLSAADICVAPEPSNTYNNRSTMIKITEYMAMGKPIVAFDLPEHRYSADDAALYAEANNEYDFAQKLAILIDNPDLRIARGAIGKQRIETRLAWTFQEEHLLSVYEMFTTSVKQSVVSH